MKKEGMKRLKINILFIFLFILFIFLFPALRINFLKETTSDTKAPTSFLSFIHKSTESIYNIFPSIKNYFVTKNSLLLEIEILREEIQNQKEIILSLHTEEKLNYNSSTTKVSDTNIISANKIFKDFTSMYDTIILDKGFIDGIEKGDEVFLYPDLAIGQIESINRNTSILKLYSKSKNKVEGIVKSGEKDIIIDIYGMGSGDFYAEIPESINISTGTIVYLSSNKNKTLGEIVRAEKREASFFQDLLIRGYYNTRLQETYFISKDK
jgi:cell shape-determining protein MreC